MSASHGQITGVASVQTPPAPSGWADGKAGGCLPPLKKPDVLKNDLVQTGQSPLLQRRPLAELKAKIRDGYQQIAANIAAQNASIVPRTQAHNRKWTFQTVEDERTFRSDILGEQIRTWRSLLPELIRKFARIPDPRRTKSVEHKIAVLMMYGLFSFIFRLTSRREMNREMTGAVIYENLKKIFPDIDSIPHADTLARILEDISTKHIEAIHVSLIQDLIRKKKFRKLLIQGCLPVTVDGAQKLYRDGILQDPRWCERMVGGEENKHKQQYIYVVEANITFRNGLTIPLMTEFLYRENNILEQSDGKQDSETTAFERLAAKIKGYFPKQKIIFFMDAMYATFPMMELLKNNQWEFIITLPKKKFTEWAKLLNKEKKYGIPAPEQEFYRGRKQTFYWENNLVEGKVWDLKIHLAGCTEEYEEVDLLTGEVKKHYSERAWICSILILSKNLHELFNLGARKKELIEDSFNTEKNRGYSYKHAFSYNLNAMQNFHLLMRLGHAINSISEFSKALKKYIKNLGLSATLKLIKETLFSPWLSMEWYDFQSRKKPQLRFQLE